MENDNKITTANTGLANLSVANPNLDGTGTMSNLITGASNGSMVHSIYYKATQNTVAGMLRLFVFDGTNTLLYKEIPVPAANGTAVEPTYQMCVIEEFYLPSGYILKVSTEKAETYDVIAFASNWTQCDCSTMDNTPKTRSFAKNGLVQISTPNSSRNGTGTITTVYTAPVGKAGSIISNVTVKVMGSSTEGMIRLWIYNGTRYFLLTELQIPAEIQTQVEPTYRTEFTGGFFLQSGFSLCASTETSDHTNIIVFANDQENCSC